MNIVFDLGGVVVSWEPAALVAGTFADPAVQARVRREILGHADWLALDRGTLPLQDAIARGAERTGLSVPEVAEFLHRVPAALVPIPDTVALLYRLKEKGHRLFCLSNMHVASIEHLEKTCAFWDLFEGKVISCRIHLIKPEPGIYAHLLERHKLKGPQIIFIDDVEVNLLAAAQFGIRTIQFENPAQCEGRLREMGCI